MAQPRKTARRKVSNLMALSLLSLLTERPMYPYEMASKLREYGKDQAIKINWGSLYTVVQNLEKHGFIEAVEVAREGRQPERTTYRITEAGRAELKDWLSELLSEPGREYTRFEAALGECSILGPDKLAGLLRQRLGALEEATAVHQEMLDAMKAQLPRLFLADWRMSFPREVAETEWVRGLLTELTDGTFPGLEAWRRYHETGEIPAEFIPSLNQEGEPAAGG